MLPALIGAGGSLLGGLFGRKSERKAIDRQNEYNLPINVRARAEQAGFNPLLFVGPGVGQQTTTGGTNYMGSAIADAGMMVADGIAKRQELGRLEKLQAENQKLAERVTNLTLRPKVGGLYASRVQTPTMAQALGGGGKDASGSAHSSGVAGGNRRGVGRPSDPVVLGQRPLSTTLPVDPRREVKNDENKTHSGFFTIDNPHLPFNIYVPTLDGDEAMGLADYATLPLLLLGNLGARTGVAIKDAQTAFQAARLKASGAPVFKIGGRTYAGRPPKPQTRPRANRIYDPLVQHDYLQPNFWLR